MIYFDKDLHFGAQTAATAFTLLMLMSNFGKFFYGWLFDRYSTKGIAFCWFMAAAGIVYATQIHSLTSLWIFAVIYGPCQAGMLLNMAILCKHLFGSAGAGEIDQRHQRSLLSGRRGGAGIRGLYVRCHGVLSPGLPDRGGGRRRGGHNGLVAQRRQTIRPTDGLANGTNRSWNGRFSHASASYTRRAVGHPGRGRPAQ